MNNCLAVIVMTLQIFLGDGQEHTITVTGCVDWDTAAQTAPQQPGGAQAIRGAYDFTLGDGTGSNQRSRHSWRGVGADGDSLPMGVNDGSVNRGRDSDRLYDIRGLY